MMLGRLRKSDGFTMVEIMVAFVLAALVSTAIYKVYTAQNKSHAVQEQVVEMQQNLRAAMFMMAREIRMAGYNPLRVAGVGIQTASANQLQFTMDITGGEADGADNDLDGLSDEDGESDGDAVDADEDITYQLSGGNLVRNGNTLAENIDALNFVYLDADGNTTATVASIRAVQITLVARATFRDSDYTDNNVYQNQNPDGAENVYTAPGDHFRRRRLAAEVKCRNL